MGGRVALVVGSQCDQLAQLSFSAELATTLRRMLSRAGWQAAGNARGLLIDPTTADLKAAVQQAFSAANEVCATLLVTFIGHGVANGSSDFYLMAKDSSASDVDSDTAFHLTQFVRERLTRYPSIDGVMFLVDACQTGQGLEGAATRWTEVLAGNRGRMEVLVASGAESAYDGCFTRTILRTFQGGLPTRGDSLLCGDLQPEISQYCVSQAQHLAYSGGNLSSGDPGLWLVPNVARSRDAVTGRPLAGLVDQLTAGIATSDVMREKLADIGDFGVARLRLVVGPAGSGKSTLLALLIRPRLVSTLEVPRGYIKAAVFLDTASTLEAVAEEVAAQLTTTVTGFREARSAVRGEVAEGTRAQLTSWDVEVMMPLKRCRHPGMRVPIVIDGLDQPRPGAREVILGGIYRLTHAAPTAELGHVRVIAGVRSAEGIDSRPELAHAHRIDVPAPNVRELVGVTAASGTSALAGLGQVGERTPADGWVIGRLVREVADHA